MPFQRVKTDVNTSKWPCL